MNFLKTASKKSVLITAGASLALLIIWIVWHRRKQAELFDAIMKEIDKPADPVNKGLTGTSADVLTADFWSPTYLTLSGHSAPSISIATATKWNEEIKKAKGTGVLPDNESAVIAVFQRLKNRTDIAKLADAWRITYGDSLNLFLQSFMDNTDVWFSGKHNYMDDLNNIIKNLPV